MASVDGQRESSSSSTSACPLYYDVCLSYRGEDTRHNFTDHLYASLCREGIRTFKDDEELSWGQEIGSSLCKAIEESRLVLVILSKNYASSKWCLKELEKIMECRKETGKIVFPVFYHVDPSHVRNQRGIYGGTLAYSTWRAALREVGNLSGWHVQNGSEADIIEEITSVILMRLSHRLLPVGKSLIGMDDRLDEIIPQMIDPLSNDVRMIGM